MKYVEALTGIDVEFGRKLWQSLGEKKTFPFQGIFWLFQMEPGIWHLFIATPRVDAVGPRNAYAELTEITKHISADSDQLFKIELISPKHPLYQALRSVFGQTASVAGTRLGNTQIGGIYIDEAYLYEIR
ncbi:MAG TPA: hypothetical protein VKL99_08920 [Candidatus Angelobacter sp.]|nr:hypothetical protein [Candidatus Angelobacter sp.]